MKLNKITIPEVTFTWRVYKDPSYCERYPWVLEIDGQIWNTYSMKDIGVETVVDIILGHHMAKAYEKAKEQISK